MFTDKPTNFLGLYENSFYQPKPLLQILLQGTLIPPPAAGIISEQLLTMYTTLLAP